MLLNISNIYISILLNTLKRWLLLLHTVKIKGIKPFFFLWNEVEE